MGAKGLKVGREYTDGAISSSNDVDWWQGKYTSVPKVSTMSENVPEEVEKGEGTGAGDDALESHDLFLHSHEHRLDGKKRVTIPSDWRKLIGKPERVFVTKVEGKPCLRCLPAREASRRLEKLRALSIADPQAEMHLENIAMNSELVSWDGQGRIRICDDLLGHAGLKDEVLMVGKVNGFELWSPKQWKEMQSSSSRPALGNSHLFAGL